MTRSRLAAAASAALALSTLGAYLLAVWIGLFGFKEIRTRAGIAAGLIEVAAFATLALAALTADPARHAAGLLDLPGAGPGAGAVSLVVGVVSGVSVAALALLGVAVVRAPASPEASAEIGGTLKTAKIGGVDVLTNANGLTLYWFAPDTSTNSACTGSCAIYWPPVPGSPTAGPASPAGSAPSSAPAAACRPPTTATRSTPTSATAAPARPTATTSTSTAASGTTSASPANPAPPAPYQPRPGSPPLQADTRRHAGVLAAMALS